MWNDVYIWVFELLLKLEGCFLFIQQTSLELLLQAKKSTSAGSVSTVKKTFCSLET